ncbi:PBECR2 nuclease fold domain-containing protein [Culicoidibacter larvae]|uniref:Transposase n=1 Tax=Culicoidibacter larvae TaxID=2579976 RepID=A0A5R8Q7M7_9FIRM|nr:PBECR2 nuclease fold domain-containing protein [Culicoidibacter larvae]TLG70287.1 transposase [Culicoidibacter larvae]
MKKTTLLCTIDKKIIDHFSLATDNCEVYIGEDNFSHMETNHPNDFKKYSKDIADIIKYPDYIACNPSKKTSIEFIKQYRINNEYVLVAVRATQSGVFFARTLFVMDPVKVTKYLNSGFMKPARKILK